MQSYYSSSSPKKNRFAQRELQKVRPYSRRPQSMQTHLKQIGHFCSVFSSSVFWQATQIVGTTVVGAQYITRPVGSWVFVVCSSVQREAHFGFPESPVAV